MSDENETPNSAHRESENRHARDGPYLAFCVWHADDHLGVNGWKCVMTNEELLVEFARQKAIETIRFHYWKGVIIGSGITLLALFIAFVWTRGL